MRKYRIVKENGDGKIEVDIVVEDQQVDGAIKNMVTGLDEGVIWIRPLVEEPVIHPDLDNTVPVDVTVEDVKVTDITFSDEPINFEQEQPIKAETETVNVEGENEVKT